MAMIDYGAVVFKNGEQINHELFSDMMKSVGWVDYPKKRWPDCNYTDSTGHSQCYEECPRTKKERRVYEDGDYRDEYEVVVADCRGKEPKHFKDRIEGNYFAYVGDEHLTICFYRVKSEIIVDKKSVLTLWRLFDNDEQWVYDWNHKSIKIILDDIIIFVKCITEQDNVYHMKFYYNGDYYDIVYGYGIDPDMKLWNKIKKDYYYKVDSRKIENLYKRIKFRSKYYKENR